ncbi:unnamed protein product [Cuscuta epithymum]|uniref:Uncharacterized protein n=1 Tax=Cuscuta epithymum TaxID=186058 RepID=A0AAV0EQQ7_9ASTE|nr:unnamed protein product [Cuscuta epithymum]
MLRTRPEYPSRPNPYEGPIGSASQSKKAARQSRLGSTARPNFIIIIITRSDINAPSYGVLRGQYVCGLTPALKHRETVSGYTQTSKIAWIDFCFITKIKAHTV